MQKVEAQHNHAQNQPAAAQRKGAALESPQGEQLAQLEAMADASPQANRLAQLAAMANASPQAAAQRRTMGMIHDGPRMAAQRRAVDAIHSSTNVAAQRAEAEEPLQAKVAQREEAPAKRNNTGLPDNLKSGIESLSGMSMDNVRVHYNSSQPAQLNAHAYAQGTDIHVAPGQEQHLPHEAWHVVQQAQGRVRPTMQMKGDVPVNDDAGLEHEADVMGKNAVSFGGGQRESKNPASSDMGIARMGRTNSTLLQLVKTGEGVKRKIEESSSLESSSSKEQKKEEIIKFSSNSEYPRTHYPGHREELEQQLKKEKGLDKMFRITDLLRSDDKPSFGIGKVASVTLDMQDLGTYKKYEENKSPSGYAGLGSNELLFGAGIKPDKQTTKYEAGHLIGNDVLPEGFGNSTFVEGNFGVQNDKFNSPAYLHTFEDSVKSMKKGETSKITIDVTLSYDQAPMERTIDQLLQGGILESAEGKPSFDDLQKKIKLPRCIPFSWKAVAKRNPSTLNVKDGYFKWKKHEDKTLSNATTKTPSKDKLTYDKPFEYALKLTPKKTVSKSESEVGYLEKFTSTGKTLYEGIELEAAQWQPTITDLDKMKLLEYIKNSNVYKNDKDIITLLEQLLGELKNPNGLSEK